MSIRVEIEIRNNGNSTAFLSHFGRVLQDMVYRILVILLGLSRMGGWRVTDANHTDPSLLTQQYEWNMHSTIR